MAIVEALDCSHCEVWDGDVICPRVAIDGIARLTAEGFKPSADRTLTIVSIREDWQDPNIKPVLADECAQKQLRHESMRLGVPVHTD